MDSDIERAARQLMSVLPLFNRLIANELRREVGETATLSQFRVLAYLHEQPMTISALAKLRRVSMQSVSDLVQGVVERGWVTRAQDPSDRRQAILEITELGRSEFERAQQRMTEGLTIYLRRLTGAELNTIQESMSILQGMLHDQEDVKYDSD